MGTNYYWREGPCETCGRSNNVSHIGKSSYGWTFSFQQHYDANTWQEWQTMFDSGGGKIFDEYDEEISVEDFKALVENKQKLQGAHKHSELHPEHSYTDPEGYSFTTVDFS